ncbi:MAG: hypothetical protein VX550_11445 [Bacteroidota bacterium]|nr:hypothetical protein [Bacteroidota bacterium]
MKNFFRVSLLAVLFIGMSGFSNSSTEEKSVEIQEEFFAQCDDMANGAYLSTMYLTGGNQQMALNQWNLVYWSCIDNGGQSDTTVVIK